MATAAEHLTETSRPQALKLMGTGVLVSIDDGRPDGWNDPGLERRAARYFNRLERATEAGRDRAANRARAKILRAVRRDESLGG